MNEPAEGWAWALDSSRAHYFRVRPTEDIVSLCGKFVYPSSCSRDEIVARLAPDHAIRPRERCAKCRHVRDAVPDGGAALNERLPVVTE